MSTRVHEPNLSEKARDIHRALASLQEELEATDWYQQRVDTTNDKELKDILQHNLDEELEHATMLVEYLRRRVPNFDEQLHTYLFTEKSLLEVEEEAEKEELLEENSTGGVDSLGLRNLNS